MPVYEYQGKHYDLSETDPTAAKSKIMSYLGQQQPPAAPKEEPGVLSKFGTAVKEHPLQVIPGAAEAVAGGVVSMGEAAVSGVAGLATAIAGQGFEKGFEGTKKALEPVDKLVEPETEVGKAASDVLAKIPELIHKGGEKVYEKTDSPLAGAGTEALGTLATLMIGGKSLKLTNREIKTEAPKEGIPPEVVDEVVGSNNIKETAFRDRKTGEVTPSGDKHDMDKKKDPNLEAGFIDGNGNFLNRTDAAKRAKETGQIPQNHELEFPEQGLHSGDLKSAKDQIHPIAHAADNIVRERINNVLASSRIIRNTSEGLNKAVPELGDRELISEAIDKGVVDSLPKHEREVANHVKGLFDDIGNKAKDLGVIDGLRENYISHIVDWSKVAPSEAARLKEMLLGAAAKREGTPTKSRFGKERKYETFDALQDAIKDTGLEIKTKDVSEIYKAYATSMTRAIENKRMINSLKELQFKDDQGVQWAIQKVSDKTPPPPGWKYIDSPQMRGYVVNPELEPMMRFVFESKDPGAIMQAAIGVTQATKRMNVVGSLFHAKSLVEAMYGNTGAIRTIGELGKMSYDKMFGTRHAAINKALEEFHKGGIGDSADKWLKSGLVVEAPEDVSIGVIGQLGRVADDTLAKAGIKTTLGERALSATEKATLGVFDKLTWDYLHTGLKLSVAEKMLETAKRNHPDIPEEQHRQEITRHINNSFGGQNWFDAATQSSNKLQREILMSAFSPEGRRGMQLLMFAPDWTVSTLRAFTSAFGEGTGVKGLMKPTKQADYARRYQMRTALIYATLINGMQMALTGKSLLSNNDPTRLEFPDGTSMQLMKHAAEPYHWIADPDKTLANKLGFLPRAAVVGLGGLQYASPTAPKLEDLSGVGRAEAVLKGVLPFQVSSAMQAPPGEGLARAAAGTLGFPVYGMTKEEAKKSRAEAYARKKKEYEKWKKEHKQ